MRAIMMKVMYLLYGIPNYPSLLFNKVRYGENLRIRGTIFVKTARRTKKHTIFIGDNVCINSSRSSDPIGGDTKTILYTRFDGEIHLADDVGISNATIIAEKGVTIGYRSILGAGVKIYDTDFHSLRPEDRFANDRNVKSKAITIGENVFIGAHSIILKGTIIGNNVVIGAGSVVSGNIPDNQIWGGNPAKYIKENV